MNCFLKKQEELKALFAPCSTVEAKYEKIIELGKRQKKLGTEHKTSQNIVRGCQSIMYMHCLFDDGKLYFQTESDAIISAGLAQLLTSVYSGESCETILRNPPKYIEELGIAQSLTPGRANGLASIYIRMKQEALSRITCV